MVLSDTNGDDEILNIRGVNKKTFIYNVSRSSVQWNLVISLSSLIILICKNACFKSPVIAPGFNGHFVSTLIQSVNDNGGPTPGYSFEDGLVFFSLAAALQVIRSSVTSAHCFTKQLCRILNSFLQCQICKCVLKDS